MKQPVMLYIDSKLMHGIGIVRYVEWSAEDVNLDRLFNDRAGTLETEVDCEMTLASWADREDDVDPAERWQMTAAEAFVGYWFKRSVHSSTSRRGVSLV